MYLFHKASGVIVSKLTLYIIDIFSQISSFINQNVEVLDNPAVLILLKLVKSNS